MEKYDEAINSLNESLTEHRNKQTLELLEKVEKMKKKIEEESYFSVEKSLEEKEKGNEFFKKQKYPESIKCYDEAIKRNPKDPNLYSNRATSYLKLAEYSYALKDIEKSLSMEPKSVKFLQKKAQIEYFSKQFHKAIDTLKLALEIDPKNEQVIEAYSKVIEASQNPEYK
jgi:stress-induced-phosphoprotein 1